MAKNGLWIRQTRFKLNTEKIRASARNPSSLGCSVVDCSPQVACTFVNSLLRSLGYLVKVIQWDQSNRG